MPITRRRRANPPDQPENNHHQPAEQIEGAGEQPLLTEPAPSTPAQNEAATPLEAAPGEPIPAPALPPVEPVIPAPAAEISQPTPQPVEASQEKEKEREKEPPSVHHNGDRPGVSDYTPTIEGGRRTARGELFRRPPQAPQPSQASFVSSAPLQAPTHEIALPLGNLLHLAYNPGYTGSEEARSLLLQRLTEESKAGGRARCWNCGSLAIAYDRWNTRSRSFGDVGVAFCEICGVWSVM